MAPLGISVNVHLRPQDLATACPLHPIAAALLKSAMRELGLSARSYDKSLKIARTIADVAGSDESLPEHIAEAIQYRSLDCQWWG